MTTGDHTWNRPPIRHMSVDEAHSELRATAARMGRTYTHPVVIAAAEAGASWADPVMDPAVIDWTARQAGAAIPFEVIDGRPVNPCARTERDHAARLRAGLRTSLDPALDMDRIRDHEATARTHEALVRDSIRETDDR